MMGTKKDFRLLYLYLFADITWQFPYWAGLKQTLWWQWQEKNCLLTGRNLEQNRTQYWAAVCLDSQHCWVSFRNHDPIPSHHSARLHHVHTSEQVGQHVLIRRRLNQSIVSVSKTFIYHRSLNSDPATDVLDLRGSRWESIAVNRLIFGGLGSKFKLVFGGMREEERKRHKQRDKEMIKVRQSVTTAE